MAKWLSRYAPLLFAMIGLASCTTASGTKQETTASSAAAKQPHWLRLPTGSDMAPLFPREAARLESSGKAIIKCQVDEAGNMKSCVVVSEEPAALGFGAATLALASKFRIGNANGGTVSIPVTWNLMR